ncbi:MAG: hypothetical protein HQL31_05700 [Planctomycetes bacterium]|nr:hypothetical protein [Planctomycetota bacterium]
MIKFVVDIQQKIMAMGGEMHADAEEVLLEAGSKQEHLWGGNLYPDREGGDRVEFTSLINIRPTRGNRSVEITDPELQKCVRAIVDQLAP